MRKTIFVKTSFVGYHHWPEAPLPVKFLRELHRHRFGVRVVLGVTGSDRELEFFMVLARVSKVIDTLVHTLEESPRMSCEHMAEYIGSRLLPEYKTLLSVEVNEDGENGAVIDFTTFSEGRLIQH